MVTKKIPPGTKVCLKNGVDVEEIIVARKEFGKFGTITQKTNRYGSDSQYMVKLGGARKSTLMNTSHFRIVT